METDKPHRDGTSEDLGKISFGFFSKEVSESSDLERGAGVQTEKVDAGEIGILVDDNFERFSVTETANRKGFNEEDNVEDKAENLKSLEGSELDLIKISKLFKITAYTNFCFDFLFAMTLPHLLPLILLNTLGYYAAKRYSRCLSVSYFVYNCLVIVARILLMIFFPAIYIVVIYSLLVIIQVSFMIIHLVFINSLLEVTPEQRLKILINTNPRNKEKV